MTNSPRIGPSWWLGAVDAVHDRAMITRESADALSVAGYELLRVIGRGSRSTVWVASPGDIAVKVVNREHRVAAIHELEALERAQGSHVVELHDVDMAGPSPALIFERLRGDSLADLMRDRAYIDAGEAVTILAPIAEVVGRLHAAGVAHGNISPATIHFRSDGASPGDARGRRAF
ncbi:MAG TPA: protein kinase [Pseudolysinimonas sp.]|nr:protein kinase [Pseudolysinimonas sp.]